jgi:hypothetical protein
MQDMYVAARTSTLRWSGSVYIDISGGILAQIKGQREEG